MLSVAVSPAHEVHAFNGFDFVFDARAKVKGRVRAHFETAKAAMESDPRVAGKLSDLVFRDDRKFVPLQAADLLAYELRKRVWQRVRGDEPRVQRTRV